MALTYDRPVTYQSQMFNQQFDYEHKPNIKRQLHSPDYYDREISCSMLSQVPSINEFKNKFVLSEQTPLQLTSWTTTHPQHWTRKEVLDWIYFVVDQEHLDGSKLQGEAYNNFVGEDLCKMDRKQFLKADPFYGSTMYETFRSLINDVSFEEPKPAPDIASLDTFNTINNIGYACLNRNINRGVTGRSLQKGDGSSDNNGDKYDSDLMVFCSENDIKVSLLGLGVYSISPEIELPLSNSTYGMYSSKLKEAESFTQPLVPIRHSELPEFSSISSPLPSSNVPLYTKNRQLSLSSGYQTNTTDSYPSSRKKSSSSKSNIMSLSSSPGGASMRSSGTSSISPSVSSSLKRSMFLSSSSSPCRINRTDHEYLSDDSCSSNMPPYHPMHTISFTDDINMDIDQPTMSMSGSFHSDGSKPKKKEKKVRNNATKNGNHLWEFVRDLLRDPEANPKLLKWEDKDHGVFRFVQSEKVAQLWGDKKNNPLMTYEKLSRAMRFCRSAGYFDIVPKTGKFPKKLCFRFGVKARGWKD